MSQWSEYITPAVAIMALGVIVKLYNKVSRLLSILEDYPPHRHVAGGIIYPKEYQPSEIEPFVFGGGGK